MTLDQAREELIRIADALHREPSYRARATLLYHVTGALRSEAVAAHCTRALDVADRDFDGTPGRIPADH